jgi:hypothetical protein
MLNSRFRRALRAAGWHLLASAVVAALAAALVFGVWYPYPFRELVGGRELFLIVVGVDVVCGPLLTLVLFNHLKSRRELTLDLSLVALIQLAALVYGLHTVVQARPVYLAFEVDRFRAVTLADIQLDKLQPELGGLHDIGWGGPKVIGVRTPKDNEEMMRSLDLSLGGIDQAVRPDWWVPYEQVKARVLEKSRPLSDLRAKRPELKSQIDASIAATGTGEDRLVWLPITSFQSTGWVAFLDASSAQIKSYAPIDGF